MNKKIPLFKKDSDIFAHIFWVTLRAAMNTRWSCTVLASAVKACLSLIDTEGIGTKVETKPLQSAAMATTHQRRTS